MHIVLGKVVKYILRFLFAVILGSFLIGFAKFEFKPSLYIEYLNSISISQLFSQQAETLSGDVLSGTDTATDTIDVSNDMVLQTGTQTTGTTDAASFGFVGESSTGTTTQEDIQAAVQVAPTHTATATGDSRTDLLNLIKSKEQ